MFGGQSCVDYDNAMGYFVKPTREEIENKLLQVKEYNEELFNEMVEKELHIQCHQAMQDVVYNLNTMHSRAGQVDLAVIDRNIYYDYRGNSVEV